MSCWLPDINFGIFTSATKQKMTTTNADYDDSNATVENADKKAVKFEKVCTQKQL